MIRFRCRILVTVSLGASLALGADFPKAFLSNNQVWIQTTPSQPAIQATHYPDGSSMSGPVISPDGRLIAFGVRENLGPDHPSALNVVFLDWSGKEIRRFPKVPMAGLGDVCAEGTVEWIDNAHIGVECEYNPSGESYEVVDAISGKVEKEFSGLYFSWSPDHRTLAHIGWILHFASPASQNYCVLFNDRVVYTPGCSNELKPVEKPTKRASHGIPAGTKIDAANRQSQSCAGETPLHFQNVHEISPPLVWSSDGRELAFVEAVYDFTWGVDEECNETYDTGNRRYYLAIVSTDHTAVGYQLTENVDQPRIAWLAGSRLKLSDARGDSGERVFDLSTNPPKPIP